MTRLRHPRRPSPEAIFGHRPIRQVRAQGVCGGTHLTPWQGGPLARPRCIPPAFGLVRCGPSSIERTRSPVHRDRGRAPGPHRPLGDRNVLPFHHKHRSAGAGRYRPRYDAVSVTLPGMRMEGGDGLDRARYDRLSSLGYCAPTAEVAPCTQPRGSQRYRLGTLVVVLPSRLRTPLPISRGSHRGRL